jgi:hypothetical protein
LCHQISQRRSGIGRPGKMKNYLAEAQGSQGKMEDEDG